MLVRAGKPVHLGCFNVLVLFFCFLTLLEPAGRGGPLQEDFVRSEENVCTRASSRVSEEKFVGFVYRRRVLIQDKYGYEM